MATTWQDIINAASTLLARWKRDVDFTSQIVNGPASGPGSTVSTDGGTIPTFANALSAVGSGSFTGQIVTSDTTQSTSISTGSIRTAGGVGIAKSIYCGGTYNGAVAASTLSASGAVTGAGFTALFNSPPAVGSVVPASGAFTTLTTTGLANFNSAQVGGVTIVTLSASQTLTNKTLTAPIIGTIVNTGTLTLPSTTDTLVGRATTDTLTNKTLTTPVIASISNGGTLTLPSGTDTLVARNTTDTLTNKTLTSPVIATIVNAGTLTLPTITDTLVGRTTTDTLTNKTLTTPVIASISNSGTITVPTGTDTLVARNTTDTLTNKTLTTPTVNGATFSGTLAGAATFSGAVAFTSTITPSQTAGIVGTNTNNNANAGSVGEILTNTTSGTSLTNATPFNATSISLTAGDWDVEGSTFFSPAGTTTVQAFIVGINTVSATVPADNSGAKVVMLASFTTGGVLTAATPTVRISIASTTTIFLVSQLNFGTSTATASGFIRARRVR